MFLKIVKEVKWYRFRQIKSNKLIQLKMFTRYVVHAGYKCVQISYKKKTFTL